MTYSHTMPDPLMNSPHGERNSRNSAIWAAWAGGGALSVTLATFMPLIHQTNADGLADLQVKNGVGQASLVIGLLILGMTVLARWRPEFRTPAAIISLIISLLMLGLYSIVTLAGFVGVSENSGFGISEQLTWMPGSGMVVSGLGYAAVILGCLLAFFQRPSPRPLTGNRINGGMGSSS